MKAKIFLAMFLICPLSFLSCHKEDDQDSSILVEEAYPGIEGELQEFIIGVDTIVVEKINGEYVFQGDIILTEDQLKSGSKKGAGLGIAGSGLKSTIICPWSCNKVYYKIRFKFEILKRLIDKAILEYEALTNLDFVEWSSQSNYVEFIVSEDGPSSNGGMIPGGQLIKLPINATYRNVLHEIGHTVGLIHEHSRLDRDKYIRIIPENIIPEYTDQFGKVTNIYQTNYFDFNSIMLYPSYAFGITKGGIKLNTITKIDGSIFNVNITKLEVGDIEVLNKIYTPDGSVTDIDGNVYRTVKIGDQTWMAENLRTTKYCDGTPIPSGNPWNPNSYDGCYWWYDNNIKYKNEFGALYDRDAVTKQLCPTGWHVPVDAEWTVLTDYLGGESVAGGKLKEVGTSHWWQPNTGATDEVCFSALPGGAHWDDGRFVGINGAGFWWCLDFYHHPWGMFFPFYRVLESDESNIVRAYADPAYGFAVRCIRNN